MNIGFLIKSAPTIGAAASFSSESISNAGSCTNPTAVVCKTGVKIAINCMPPNIKYPLLCASLACTTTAFICTGSPHAATASFVLAEAMIPGANVTSI